VLGLGGHTYPVGNGSGAFMTPDDRARLVHYLVSSGVNYFDTTWINEVRLLADSFRRADIKEGVLVSLQSDYCIRDVRWREKLRQEVESRVSILGYADAPLFLMGLGEGDVSYGEIISACEAMMRLKEERLIRNIGVSCHDLSLFPLISRAIRETGLIDYMMIRFNWKFQRAQEELFPVAKEHDVGIVLMKMFCWDCCPTQWNKRISVFEPVSGEKRTGNDLSLTPAQRHILWCIQNSHCDVVVPAMNSMEEANENIRALRSIDSKVGTDDFEEYRERLWNKKELKRLASHAKSAVIREQARLILNPRPRLYYILGRTIKAHYRVLRDEGLKGYFLRSYHYRRGQASGWIRKILT
jgi:predicted aldo/keto reductase-like oxidoreductase